MRHLAAFIRHSKRSLRNLWRFIPHVSTTPFVASVSSPRRIPPPDNEHRSSSCCYRARVAVPSSCYHNPDRMAVKLRPLTPGAAERRRRHATCCCCCNRCCCRCSASYFSRFEALQRPTPVFGHTQGHTRRLPRDLRRGNGVCFVEKG